MKKIMELIISFRDHEKLPSKMPRLYEVKTNGRNSSACRYLIKVRKISTQNFDLIERNRETKSNSGQTNKHGGISLLLEPFEFISC